MKVSFWSNSKGHSGVTSNLACMSVMDALLHHHKIILFENHYNLNSLEHALVSRSMLSCIREDSCYPSTKGLEHLMSLIRMSSVSESLISNVCIPIYDDCVYFIPQNTMLNQEVLMYELCKNIQEVMEFANQNADHVFIDTGDSTNVSTLKVVDDADIVVVNLTQNPHQLSHFFRNYSQIQQKAFYLIGNYNANSELSLDFISQNYHISRDKIFAIPYNVHFSDAVAFGKTVPFLLDNYYCHRGSANYEFIQSLKNAVQGLESMMSISNERRCVGEI